MKIAIAILTYNRPKALATVINSINKCSHSRIGIFEDGGLQSELNTLFKLEHGKFNEELQAIYYRDRAFDIYVGTRNLGIAKNTNRAIRWFDVCTDCDYLLLCNDDIEFTGNASKDYYEASVNYDIGLFCFNSAENGTLINHKFIELSPPDSQSQTLDNTPKFVKLDRLYGAVLAMPRSTIEKVGYFDARFGQYGEEHVEFTSRCYGSGLSKNIPAIDLYKSKIKMQDVIPTLPENLVKSENVKAKDILLEINKEFQTKVDFSLQSNLKVCGNEHTGISTGHLLGYHRVSSWENFIL